MYKSIILKTLLFSLIIVNSFGQKVISNKIDPYSVILKVLNYSHSSYYNGTAKTGYVYGDSYFDFSKMSRQFPNVLVTYTALNRQAREGGTLKNIKFINSGVYNTKIIVADWVNFDQNSGSGTFELSILGENSPNKIYIGIKGYSWQYYFNIELTNQQFQELINLLTISGIPKNPIKEREDKQNATIAAEKFQKEESERKYRIQLELERRAAFSRDSLKKIKEDENKRLLYIKQQEDEKRKRFSDSIDLIKDDSLKNILKVTDLYKDGIVIMINGNGHGVLISKLLVVDRDISSWENTVSLMFNKLSYNGWDLPTRGSNVIDIFEKMYKDESFRIKFKGNGDKDYFRLCMYNHNKKKSDIMAFLVGNKPWEIMGKSNEDYSKVYFFGFKEF